MKLGEPLRLGPVTLRNRIVGAPTERNYCASDGTMTPEYVTYLEARAAGEAALMFTDLAVGIRVSALEGTPGGLDTGRTLELVRSALTGILPVVLYVPGLGSVFDGRQRHDRRV